MTGIGSYSSATAFRQALEDRLKAEALQTGVPYDRLRKEAAFHRLLARLQRVAPQDSWALKGALALIARIGARMCAPPGTSMPTGAGCRQSWRKPSTP